LRQAALDPGEIHLLLTDLVMPGMSRGWSWLSVSDGCARNMAIIFMSGNSEGGRAPRPF